MQPWSMGVQIRELRKILKISQKALARETQLSSTSISRYERGTQVPTQDSIERILGFFREKGLDYQQSLIMQTAEEEESQDQKTQDKEIMEKMDRWTKKNFREGKVLKPPVEPEEMKAVYYRSNREMAWAYITVCWKFREMQCYMLDDSPAQRESIKTITDVMLKDILNLLNRKVGFQEADLPKYMNGTIGRLTSDLDERRLINLVGVLYFRIHEYDKAMQYFQMHRRIIDLQNIVADEENCCNRFNIVMTKMLMGELLLASQEMPLIMEQYYFLGNMMLVIVLVWGRMNLEYRLGQMSLANKDVEWAKSLLKELNPESKIEYHMEDMIREIPLIWYF